MKFLIFNIFCYTVTGHLTHDCCTVGKEEEDIFTTIASLATELSLDQLFQAEQHQITAADDSSAVTNPPDHASQSEGDLGYSSSQSEGELADLSDQSEAEAIADGLAIQESISHSLAVDFDGQKEAGSEDTEPSVEAVQQRNSTRNR